VATQHSRLTPGSSAGSGELITAHASAPHRHLDLQARVRRRPRRSACMFNRPNTGIQKRPREAGAPSPSRSVRLPPSAAANLRPSLCLLKALVQLPPCVPRSPQSVGTSPLWVHELLGGFYSRPAPGWWNHEAGTRRRRSHQHPATPAEGHPRSFSGSFRARASAVAVAILRRQGQRPRSLSSGAPPSPKRRQGTSPSVTLRAPFPVAPACPTSAILGRRPHFENLFEDISPDLVCVITGLFRQLLRGSRATP
jgi:hypothetical protein